MKRLRVVFWLLAGVVAVGLCACAVSNPTPLDGGPYWVRIPWLSDGKYTLQSVELKTLQDPIAMNGSSVTFILDPNVQGGETAGSAPRARFLRTSDGLWVPLDTSTAQMAAAYAHMERLVENLKAVDGSILPLPRKVGFNTATHGERKDGSRYLVTNNALYFGNLDLLAITPFDLQDMALSFNAGVIAHEFFHAIFNEKAMKDVSLDFLPGVIEDIWNADAPETNTAADPDRPLTEKELEILKHNFIVLRAANEGLADFWGWYYSGDEAFVARSLGSAGVSRAVSGKAMVMSPMDMQTAISKAKSIEQLAAYAYKLGSSYANFAKALADIWGKEETAKRMLESLAAYKPELQTADTKKIKVSIVADSILSDRSKITLKECAAVKGLFDKSMERDDLYEYCESVK